MTRHEAVKHVFEKLRGIYSADDTVTLRAAQQIVQAVLKCTFEELVTRAGMRLHRQEREALEEALFNVREKHMPLAYLIGSVTFAGLYLAIRPPVLIPRPETEEWVVQLIEHLKSTEQMPGTILDLCTGSGCIALALAHAFPSSHVVGSDINEAALALAQENASRNEIKNVTWLKSDLFSQITDQTFDLIVSNPPYIPEGTVLDKSVSAWEHEHALFAGAEGLDLIKPIVAQAQDYLTGTISFPALVLEIDRTQGEAVKGLCRAAEFSRVECMIDMNGHDRTIWAGYK